MEKNSVSLIRKLVVLGIDFTIFQGFLAIVYVSSDNLLSNLYNEWSILFGLVVYLLYYVLSEYLFYRTFAMWITGVSISFRRDKDRNKFLKYSLLIFLDRNVLAIIYIFRVLLSIDKPIMISEKYSGVKWER